MKNKLLSSSVLALALLLSACNQPNTPVDSSGEESKTGPIFTSEEPIEGELANGSFDLSGFTWQEKSKIVAALEKYAMENHSAGIPLYDDASYQQFSKRVRLPSTRYLTNYGFGVGYGTIEGLEMYDGDIYETVDEWKSYFHGYTNTDSGTFNGWDATGADVSDRMSMIASSYFGVKANDENTDYYWVGSLSKTDAPIMLNEEGEEVDLSGLDEDEMNAKTSQFWRVKLHTGAGYTYHYDGKSDLKAIYDGKEVEIEDYLTPFRTMLDNKLTRYAELVSDAGGLQGAMEYVYDSTKQQEAKTDWTKSGVGVQISPDGDGLDFSFIQPKSLTYARTNLSSMLYSPVPQSFIDAVGVSNYGKIVEGETPFENVLCFGAYIPESYQSQKLITYKRNAEYYEASDYHYAGYKEVIFSGDQSDVLAYDAFLNNELDEVTIPVSQIEAHKSEGYKTEGSTIIKLNLNTCTEEEWNYYFGPNGTTYKHPKEQAWDVKPIMSNDNFINGIYFAINRPKYAEKAGRNPAMGYLSNAYMLDPAGKVSYRSSEAGEGVLNPYNEVAGEENFGFSEAAAQALFGLAAKEMIEGGYYDADELIEIEGLYRYQSTIDNIGKYVAQDIQDNFNKGAAAAGYPSLKLKVNLKVGGSTYTETYTKMDHGEFDFAEGAISGNVLNPLEFMNTLSTTKSLHQGFNLNWGHRTDVVQAKHPAVYTWEEDGETKGGLWSYDALYNSAQGFTPVEDGCSVDIASNESIYARGDNIIWRAEFPSVATDDEGKSLFTFKLNDFAVLTANSGTPGGENGGGYYVRNALISTDENGYIMVTVKKSEITSVAAQVASSEGKTQNVFIFWFTLVYSVKLESGTITKAKQIITSVVNFTDVGMQPVGAN